jgi:glycosyltransferase involved in cell wall biosynthesis
VTRVVIGASLYSGGEYVASALDSLLSQTYRDFRLVLCDDQSNDLTWEAAERHAVPDARVHVERNPIRLGMIGNWRRCFEVARSICPEMEYFAWASDHDLWDPGWLEALVHALDADPRAVLAHPRAVGVRDGGEVVHRPRDIDTGDIVKRRPRMRETWHRMSAGYMVYGLYRADALESCGVYRYVRDPDRLLMFELSAHGTFRQVPETLYYRRRTADKPTPKRQMQSFFPGRRRPLYTRLPWPLVHAFMVTWSLAVKGNGKPAIGRLRGVGLGLWYLKLGAGLEARRQIRLGQRSSLAPVRLAAGAAGRFVALKPPSRQVAGLPPGRGEPDGKSRSPKRDGPKRPKGGRARKPPKTERAPKQPKEARVPKRPKGERPPKPPKAQRTPKPPKGERPPKPPKAEAPADRT